MREAWGTEIKAAYRGWTIVARRVGKRGEYSATAYHPRYPSLNVATGPISGRGARTQAIYRAKSLIDARESEFPSETQEAQS
jgi:hypothetical protein